MRPYDELLKLDIVKFIEKFYIRNNRSPSLKEIADGVKRAKSTVYNYVLKMVDEGMLSNSEEGLQTSVTKKVNTSTVPVGVVGSIACGTPTYAEENITEYINLPSFAVRNGNYFILVADGDSMQNAGISNGDYVLIRQQNTAEEGQIIAALLDNEATLKRFYKDEKNKRFILHPENESYSDIYVDELLIQGVAVSVVWKDLM